MVEKWSKLQTLSYLKISFLCKKNVYLTDHMIANDLTIKEHGFCQNEVVYLLLHIIFKDIV